MSKLLFKSDEELFEYVMEHGPKPLPRDHEAVYGNARAGNYGEALDTYIGGVKANPDIYPLFNVIRDNIELLEWSYGVQTLAELVGAESY